MILKIARERNFSEDIVTSLIKNPEPIGTLGALSPEQKFEYLYSSIELVFADHNIFESEILFCKNIAVKLGFKKGVVDYFVNNYGKKLKEELKQAALSEYL